MLLYAILITLFSLTAAMPCAEAKSKHKTEKHEKERKKEHHKEKKKHKAKEKKKREHAKKHTKKHSKKHRQEVNESAAKKHGRDKRQKKDEAVILSVEEEKKFGDLNPNADKEREQKVERKDEVSADYFDKRKNDPEPVEQKVEDTRAPAIHEEPSFFSPAWWFSDCRLEWGEGHE